MVKIVRQSLAEQVYSDLKKQIILNKLESGQKITIKDIQDMYSVSSTPAREALNMLASEGLISIQSNVGAHISQFSKKDSLEIHDLAALLDTYALEYALKNADRHELIEKVEAAFHKHEKEDSNEELAKQFYENYFHNVFFEFVSNSRILNIKERNRAEFAIVVYKARYNRDPHESENEHLKVLEAIKANDDALAIKMMEEHFANGRQRLIDYYDNLEAKKTNQ